MREEVRSLGPQSLLPSYLESQPQGEKFSSVPYTAMMCCLSLGETEAVPQLLALSLSDILVPLEALPRNGRSGARGCGQGRPSHQQSLPLEALQSGRRISYKPHTQQCAIHIFSGLIGPLALVSKESG